MKVCVKCSVLYLAYTKCSDVSIVIGVIWFSTRGVILPLIERLAISEDIFGITAQEGSTTCGWRPGMLLNVLQCTG